MERQWIKISFSMPEKNDYLIMQSVLSATNKDEMWPVEEFDEKNKTIHLKQVIGQIDDAVEFTEIVDDMLKRVADMQDTPEAKKTVNNTSFEMTVKSWKYGSTKSISETVERKNGKLIK